MAPMVDAHYLKPYSASKPGDRIYSRQPITFSGGGLFSRAVDIPMKFQLKIILVTLLILVTTLLLNSVLSLASFEKIYVTSLVSTFEVAGKNLQRKIEQSLRFGKPLDKFRGMNLLLAEVTERNPNIGNLGICSPKGLVYYHIREGRVGKNVQFDLPNLADKKDAYTNLNKGQYITFIPLHNRSKKMVGFVLFSFSREVVYEKLKTMAADNLKALWILMLLTSMSLIVFMTFMIVRPIKGEIAEIAEMLKWFEDMDTTRVLSATTIRSKRADPSIASDASNLYNDSRFARLGTRLKILDLDRIKNEVDRLAWHVYKFVTNSFSVLSRIDTFKEDQILALTECAKMDEAEEKLNKMLKDGSISIQEEDKKKLTQLIYVNRNLRKALRHLSGVR